MAMPIIRVLWTVPDKKRVIVRFEDDGTVDTVSVNDRLVSTTHKVARAVLRNSEAIFSYRIPRGFAATSSA